MTQRSRQVRAVIDACRTAVEGHDLDERDVEELTRLLPRRTCDITIEVARLAALDARRSPTEPTWKASHEKADRLAEHVVQRLDEDLARQDAADGVPVDPGAVADAIRQRGHVRAVASAGHEGAGGSVTVEHPT